MRVWWRLVLIALWGICGALSLQAQMPFYTDNPDVTDLGTLHFEFFNEFDGLQSSQYPNLRQNTANFKLNYGLPHDLELDFDIPFLSIYRTAQSQGSNGLGDSDMGVKWNFHKTSRPLNIPAFSSSLYIEFPTGDTRQELGSGLTDYWLNFITQEPLTDKTRINANIGFLFAGNTSTGVLGVLTTRGHVYTGGLSVLHDINSRLTLGSEIYGGVSDNHGLGKDQLQFLVGGEYELHNALSVTFALLGGSHVGSPKIGGQVGFEVDFPTAHNTPTAKQSSFNQTSSPSTQWR
jgi:hypothetical protein